MVADSGGGTSRTLILGAGWVGSRLAKRLASEGHAVTVTNRPGTIDKVKPLYFRPVTLPDEVSQRIEFDINLPETWVVLPSAEEFDTVVVTFPLASERVIDFWTSYLKSIPNVLCYSSTSVYEVYVVVGEIVLMWMRHWLRT